MSVHLRRSSPKVLPIKACIASPKSITAYLKELDQADKDGTVSNAVIKLTEETNRSNSDAVATMNILNILRSSSKLVKKVRDVDDEICDFKFIENLNETELPFDEKNSFLEQDETAEEISEGLRQEESQTSVNRSFPLDEELAETEGDEERDWLNRFNLELLMGKLNLDRGRRNNLQLRYAERKDKYLKQLSEIRLDAVEELNNFRTQDEEIRNENQNRLEQLENIAEKEALVIGEKYMEAAKERRSRILEKIEEVNIAKAESKVHISSLLKNLMETQNLMEQQLLQLQKDSERFKATELHKIAFEDLPKVFSVTSSAVRAMDASSATEEEINAKLNHIKGMAAIIQNVKKLIANAEEEEKKMQPKIAEQSVSGNQPLAVPATVQPEQLSGDPLQIQPIKEADESSQLSLEVPYTLSPQLEAAQKIYYELKAKFNAVSSEANQVRDNVQLRPLLARTIGIVNQLNNSKHDSSNRGKLQQLINLISGRTCTFGDTTVSTQNNPAAQAFVKEQLASKLISLSHDIQVSTMAVYASLIVRLWQIYPDLGSLILYKLYETCPFLVPLTIKKSENQSLEEYNRALGFRHKDGAAREAIDKYLTRMGAAAQLYGRLISMEIENHPHGIAEGWKWLARTLISPPFPSITAALLNGFLFTAGCALNNQYKKQFQKLLHFLYSSYMPLIEKDTLEGGHSDVVALKLLLQDYANTGSFPPPAEGYKLLL